MSEVVVPDKLNRLFVSYSDSFSKAEATEIIADLRTKQLHPKSDSLESDDLYGTLKELYKTGKIDIDDFAMLELMAGKDRVTKVTSLINDYKRSHVTSKDDGLIGRNQDRKRLLEYLTDKENHAIGLYGPSGVGKTKLARSVGSELERDSWVVLTFDARDLKDVSSLYMCILYELGLTTLARNVQEMQKEQSLADMEKMRILCDLSDKSSHSKTLLIFDNIEEKLVINDKQFSTFINDITNLPVCDKGSLKSIITSTEDLHSYFDLVKPQLLKPLPDRESSQFICRSSKLGQKPDLNDEDVQALSKISEYCRRLPYLLEGAEQIMRNGFISPLQLLQQIEAQIEKGVPENFALTATQFDSISNERLKELAVKICVFQRPFSASAVTKVAEISPDFAAIDLEYLVKHRVITKTISDNKARFDIHYLFKGFVASYLRKKISVYDEVYQRAEQMFGIHFVDKLVELANHLEKDFTRVYKKMDKNRLNFEMALQLSTKNKEILGQLLHIKYHESICRVAMLLESLKSIGERRRLFKTWADVLENEGNLLNCANMRCWESIQLADIEGTASSERILKQAEACLKQASDHSSLDVEQFSAIKGLFLYCEGNLYYRKHVNLSKQEKNKHGLIENALRKLEGSLEFHKQIYGEDHTMIVRIRNMIGNCYMEKEEPDTAEKYYSLALEMMKRLTNGTENHSEIPTFYNQLSQVYEKLGDKKPGVFSSVMHLFGSKSDADNYYEMAVESLNRALQLNEQLNLSDTLSTATFNRNLANIFMALKRYDKALECAEKSYKLRNRLLGKHPETVRILYLKGIINEWRKELGAALQSYEEAFNMEELLPLENHSVVVTKLGNRLEAMCRKCNEKRKLREYRPRIKQLLETIKKQPAKEQHRKLDEKELLVVQQGGLYNVSSHGFFLHIPQDAFKDKTQITYNHPPDDSLPSPAKDMEAVVSFIVELGPSDAVPLKPITITLMHSGIVGVPEYENIVMAFDANTQTWEELQEIKDKSLLPIPMEDSPASFIQARLTKLTAVTVVSRLVTDSFEVPVSGQLVRSSVCQDVTLQFLEGAVNKPMQGRLKVLPASSVLPEDMASFYLSPMVIVDGFEGVHLSKSAILTFPHPCPSQRSASQIHVMCFKENQWKEITESVQYSKISESRMEIRINHFSILLLLIGPVAIPPAFYAVYKWWNAPQGALFAVFKMKDLGNCRDKFKLTLSCSPSYMWKHLYEYFPKESYKILASETSTMKANDEASVTVEGDFISRNDNVILRLERNVCQKEINLQKRPDNRESEGDMEIRFLSKEDGRNLGQLTVYESQLEPLNMGSLRLSIDPNDEQRVYRMRSSPRGVLVIINIKTFEHPHLENRAGSETDVNDLKNLFIRYLNFKCIDFGNNCQTPLHILTRLREIADNDDYRVYDSIAVCILSHGEKDFFYASNGRTVRVKQVYTIFSNTSSAVFRDKPKLFFIQACRGTSGREITVQSDAPDYDMSDLLIAYPCCPGFNAFRDIFLGSFFIQSIVKVFREDAREHHVVEMMSRVTREVRAKIRELYPRSEGAQVPVYESTLLKKLYFWPETP